MSDEKSTKDRMWETAQRGEVGTGFVHLDTVSALQFLCAELDELRKKPVGGDTTALLNTIESLRGELRAAETRIAQITDELSNTRKAHAKLYDENLTFKTGIIVYRGYLRLGCGTMVSATVENWERDHGQLVPEKK